MVPLPPEKENVSKRISGKENTETNVGFFVKFVGYMENLVNTATNKKTVLEYLASKNAKLTRKKCETERADQGTYKHGPKYMQK